MMFQPGNLTITGSYPKPNLRTLVKVHENSRDHLNRCFNNLFVNSMHTTKFSCIKSQSYNIYAENLPTKLDVLIGMFLCLQLYHIPEVNLVSLTIEILFQTRSHLCWVGLKHIWGWCIWFFQKLSRLDWFFVCRGLLKICCPFIVRSHSNPTCNQLSRSAKYKPWWS